MHFCHPPTDYAQVIGDLPENVIIVAKVAGTFDFIQLFARNMSELTQHFSQLKSALKQNGMLWVSWPKKSSRVETDLTGDVVREFGLQQGLVDVKICAVDETWSGLKFVYRLIDRK